MKDKQWNLFSSSSLLFCKWSVNFRIMTITWHRLGWKHYGRKRFQARFSNYSKGCIVDIVCVRNNINPPLIVVDHLICSDCRFKQCCIVADLVSTDWFIKLKMSQLFSNMNNIRLSICYVRVASILIWWRHNHSNYQCVLVTCGKKAA